MIDVRGGGIDSVYTSVSFTLSHYAEKLYATGSASIALTGNSFGNTISGNNGANKINGHWGSDVLIGGLGRDKFIFKNHLNKTKNLDWISDFKAKDDTFWLDNKFFKSLGKRALGPSPAK